MNRVNRIVIFKENYDTNDEFENAIKSAIMLLLNAGYVMTVDYDEKALGIVCIDYDYSNPEYGGYLPYWLLPEEEETVIREGDN